MYGGPEPKPPPIQGNFPKKFSDKITRKLSLFDYGYCEHNGYFYWYYYDCYDYDHDYSDSNLAICSSFVVALRVQS